RPPPTPPLFPYTTLFRSYPGDPQVAARVQRGDDEIRSLARVVRHPGRHRYQVGRVAAVRIIAERQKAGRIGRADVEQDLALSARSEEHTSELQSLAYLVC